MNEEPLHLSTLVFKQAKKYGKRPVLYQRNDATGTWESISWNEFAARIKQIGAALINSDINEGDKIGIFAQNMTEAFIADFANFTARAVTVPMYATSTAGQIEYIVNDSEIPLIFVGEQYQYDVACEVLKNSKFLKKLVVMDASTDLKGNENAVYFHELLQNRYDDKVFAEMDNRMAKASQNDLVNILYTSGTTGQPKGVLLHQYNYTQAIRLHDERLYTTSDKDKIMVFLPITHIFERAWDTFCLHRGCTLYINRRPAEIQKTILEVRPNMMSAVPRYWEKVYAAVNDKIEHSPKLLQSLFRKAIRIGRIRNLEYNRYGKHSPYKIGLTYKFFCKPLFRKVYKAAGIENGKFFPCAGAKLSDEINEFMHAIGINLMYGYGLTESTATVCCYLPDNRDYVIGSIGRILPDVEVKISNEGEILLRGKTITSGYYNRPDANKDAFTEDGWFRTGDCGYIDHENNLYLTDRLKDLFKTAGGKYIAPQLLEGIFCNDKYIDQAAAIGNEHKYVSMLIVPDFPALEEYAEKNGIKYNNRKELVAHPEVIKLYDSVIAERNKGLARYEQVKRYTLLDTPFSMEKGLLTNTLKVKRKVVNELYAKEIAAMYPDE